MAKNVNLYLRPETVEALDVIADYHGLPSRSAAVAFVAKKESREIRVERGKTVAVTGKKDRRKKAT